MSDKESKPLILIVDDTPQNLQVLGNILREMECEIAVATNGERAIEIVHEALPDLILLDVMMPGMDGFTACEKIKSHPGSREIPVIFLTAKTEQEDIVRGFEAGAVDYLTKPFHGAELLTRVRTHLSLKRTRDELKVSIQTKNKLFNIIAHDLRNPLSTILGFADLLNKQQGEYDPDQIKLYSEHIFKSANAASDLLVNLLEWSRVQTGKMKAKLEEVSVSDLFVTVSELMEPTADKKQIELSFSEAEGMVVKADFQMISTVLRNLVSNALKFTEQGGKVYVSVWQEDQNNNLRISVEDNGTGIPEKDMNQLFSIEGINSSKGTANEEGTGLGLILCREFIKLNGGTLWAESQEGKGSTFHFTLDDAAFERDSG